MEIRLECVQGEEREGYYVQPMMKRVWAVQLDMLKEIDAICRRHSIKYYGWFGTLLGAVRHHGIIPWDDDLDLAMLREDYELFRSCLNTELPEGWEVSEREPTLITIYNTSNICLDQQFLDRFHGCPFIIGLDIFCLDRIPLDEAEEQLQLNLFWAVYVLCMNWDLPGEDEAWKDMSKWEYLEEIGKLCGYNFEKEQPIKEQLYFLGDRIAAMYWDIKCDEITNMGVLHDDFHYRIPKSCFDRIIEVPFENTTIPILKDYDLICKLSYGDYMIPVKEDNHDYLKKQVKYLRNYFEMRGEIFPEAFNMMFE